MSVLDVKFAFLCGSKEVAPWEFVEYHFGIHEPAKAGEYASHIKYQIWDVFCQHDIHIEQDSRIFQEKLGRKYKRMFSCGDETKAYYMFCPRFSRKKKVYFLMNVRGNRVYFIFFDTI